MGWLFRLAWWVGIVAGVDMTAGHFGEVVNIVVLPPVGVFTLKDIGDGCDKGWFVKLLEEVNS